MKVKRFSAFVIALCMAVTLTACFSYKTVGVKNVIADSSEVGADIDVSYEIISFGGRDWRVLDVKDGKALLLSVNIIEKRAYHSEQAAIKWKNSDIRQYLNNAFYNKFSDEDKARISETLVVNSDNPDYGTSGGNDTDDKIFLLSIDEVQQYLPTSLSRIANYGGEASWWWLRSPGGRGLRAAGVDGDGIVGVRGIYVFIDNGGVRPALWLNL